MKSLLFSLTLLLCFGLTACETETPAVEEDVVAADTVTTTSTTIVDSAMSDDQFSTLVQALHRGHAHRR